MGIINLGYHFFLGRALGTETYGEFGALYALAYFLSYILIISIRLTQAKYISTFKGQNNRSLIPSFHFRVLLKMLIFGFISFTIFVLLSGYIADFLHIESITLILYVGIFFMFTWLVPVNLGTLQGLQKFKRLALANITMVVSRFIVCVGLVLLGFGIYGAIGGLIVAIIITLFITFCLIWEYIKIPGSEKSKFSRKMLKKTVSGSELDMNFFSTQYLKFSNNDAYKFSFFVLITIICITIPTNIDVILVKHFFSTYDSGLYTAASIFGKMIYYLPIGITTAMYPKVIEAHAKKDDTSGLLKRSLIYTSIPSGLLVIAFILFPKFFLGLFYGEEYLEADSLIVLYGPFMFFFSLTAVLVYYNLAKNRYGFIYLFVFLSCFEIILIWFFHNSLIFILEILLIMNIIIFILSASVSYYYVKQK